MEYLRAHHDVDAVVGEWQMPRITTDRPVQRLSTRSCQHTGGVESNGRQNYSVPRRDRPRACGNVAEAGSDVEQCCIQRQLRERVRQLVHRRADTTEQRICFGDIGKRARNDLRIDIRAIEYLESASPSRS